MNIALQNQKNLLISVKSSIIGQDVVLVSLDGHEAISQLFEFRATILSPKDNIDLEKALNTPITITIKSDKQERNINGIIAQFSQGRTELKDTTYLTEYHVTIRPKLWLLTLDRNHLIFQKKDAVSIIKEVLSEGGIKDISLKAKTRGKTVREFCVQYAESSFNFISRLMEEEGIFYFFQHTADKHTLVIADNSSAHEDLGESTFAKSISQTMPMGVLYNAKMETTVNTGSSAVADYNYTNSSNALYGKSASKYDSGQCYYEYPGNFSTQQEGTDLTKLRAELFEVTHCLLYGDSTIANLIPGYSFKISGHPSSIFNAAFVVLSVEHHVSVSAYNNFAYSNRFCAFKQGVEFRPPRLARKPRIYGTQTAVVVCPSGEEIYRNEHCAIKIHFHWDQKGKKANTDDSSCWVRVAQQVAGSSWGMVMVPRVGQEVVVSFLEGDPDRPLVVGCVYNDKNLPPYSDKESMKSALKTVTFTNEAGFNELRFNDEKDKEEIYLHAQKDVTIEIVNSRTTTITESDDTLTLQKGNRTITLSAGGDKPANHSLTLTKGNEQVELTEGDLIYTIKKGNSTIQLDEGNDSITLKKGNRTITLSKGDLTCDVTGNITIKASDNVTIEAGKAVTIKSGQGMDVNAGQKLTIKAGTELKVSSGTAASIKSGTDAKIQAGTGMDLKAGTNFKASATLNMELSALMKFAAKGTISAELGGAIIQINGTGVSKVAGAMVQLTGIVKIG